MVDYGVRGGKSLPPAARVAQAAEEVPYGNRLCRSGQHGRGDRKANAVVAQAPAVRSLPARVEALAKAGGQPTQSLTALAEQSDMVCMCLPTSNEVRTVIFGEGGCCQD